MKAIFKHLVLFLLLILTLQCTDKNDEILFGSNNKFRAFIGGSTNSNTILDGEPADVRRKIYWEPKDSICITTDNAAPSISKFVYDGSEVVASAVFSGGVPFSDTYYALYPYSSSAKISSEGFVFSLPWVQTYKEGSFATGMYPMVAESTTTALEFNNLCGILELNLTGNVNIAKIKFSGIDGSGDPIKVAGDAIVTLPLQQAPSILMQPEATEILTLDCGAGVALNNDAPTAFFIVLPPATYDNFTLTITSVTGRVLEKTATKPLTISRSKYISTASLDFTLSPDASEKEALISLYNATDGDNWINNDNWNSEAPIETWYGVGVKNGYVISIELGSNGLKGKIPTNIGNLKYLMIFNVGNNDGGSSDTNNQISFLDVSNNPSLKALNCTGNQLAVLNVLSNADLEHLYCSSNQLSALDVSKNPNLELLYCYANELTVLEISDNPNLKHLVCSSNQLSVLDIVKNKALKALSCDGNRLEALDLTQHISLESLDCKENLLNSLTIYNIKDLLYLSCGNQLEGRDLSLFLTPSQKAIWDSTWSKDDVNKSVITDVGDSGTTLAGVTTSTFKSITGAGAILGGEVVFAGQSVSSRGVVWGINENPTIDLETKTEDGSGEGKFTSTITGLTPKTTYYVRAYATNSIGTAYGEQYSFLSVDEKKILIALYNSTRGNNWVAKNNWNSDRPLAEWHGVGVENGRIVSIELPMNNLEGTLTSEIGYLTNLRRLNLSMRNKLIGSIPAEISNLESLEHLDLSQNQFTGSIPTGICNLKNLKHIDLGKNQLTGSIPTEIGNLINLTWLVFGTNKLTGSIPLGISNLRNLSYLDLGWNELEGSIPSGIGQLTKLTHIYLGTNKFTSLDFLEIIKLTNLTHLHLGSCSITGSIPPEIGNLTNIMELNLENNNFSGPLPSEIGNLGNLIELNLGGNKLTGSIPPEIVNLNNLRWLYLWYNQFTGTISPSILGSPIWDKFWRYFASQNEGYGFDLTNVTIPGRKDRLIDIYGGVLDCSQIYSQNKYTVFLCWDTWCPISIESIDKLLPFYKKYHSSGLEVIAYTETELNSYIEERGLDIWKNFNRANPHNNYSIIPEQQTPLAEVIDSRGNIIFTYAGYNSKTTDNRLGKSACYDLIPFLEEKFGDVEVPGIYESTDYSQDGKVLTLQSATVGLGIDLVLVGDAFSDKDMGAGGKYEQRMGEAMEHFFSEEPYTSYRDRYNVYSVKAVSKNEVYESGAQTVFSCQFGEGTSISGNDNKVFEYALKVPGIASTDDLTVITILNSPSYAGTCYMYDGNNASVSYCPIIDYNDEQYRRIITHEAGGHGFAKLADEYFYPGTITAGAIDDYQYAKTLDWYANADITNGPATIRWAHFLSDPRYNSHVSIYEGALTYAFGAYRPTVYSIMRENTGGYNAPSREAIFKLIMVLSGDSYNYEDFVAYDAKNRTASAMAAGRAQAATVDKETFIPLAPPVIIRSSPRARKR